MGKINIKCGLSRLVKLRKTVCTKMRYRSEILAKETTAHLSRIGANLGRKIGEQIQILKSSVPKPGKITIIREIPDKINLKYRLRRLAGLGKPICIKVRYRTEMLTKAASVQLRRFGINLGREIVEYIQFLNKSARKSALKLVNIIVINRKKVAVSALGVCVFAFCALSIFNAMTAYQYSYNGQVLGMVEEPSCVYSGVEQAEESLTERTGTKIIIEEDDIEVKRVLKETSSVGAEEDVANALTAIDKINVVAYAVNITNADGEKQQLYVDSEESANNILDAVKAQYLGDYKVEDYLEISFEESVSVEETKALLEDIQTTEAALKAILTGGVDEKVHIVENGDSLASIAEKYDVSRKKVKKWNPEIKDDNIIYVNQEIQLQEQIPLINVVTRRNETFNEDYDSVIKYTDTDDLYKGQEIITKEGKSGNRTVNADIIEKNGVQVDRIDLFYTVNKEQETSKVMRGTRERPDKIGEGYYLYPMNGNFSSPFGPRWGRMHNGIDISGPVGTNVYAADAGTVVSAGYQDNGYGVVVEISHGDGRTTFYAHNSEVLVKVGDLVYRGQHIAESGNTGSSTGPHLHFETRFDGVAENPQKYL